MSFPKALQKAQNTIEDAERMAYINALMLYKQEKSEYAKFLNTCRSFKNSPDRTQRLIYLERKDTHSKKCRDYYDARQRWIEVQARRQFGERGVDISTFDLARLANISIPLSAKSLKKETNKAYNVLNSVKGGERTITIAAFERAERNGTITEEQLEQLETLRAMRKQEEEEILNMGLEKYVGEPVYDSSDTSVGDFEPLEKEFELTPEMLEELEQQRLQRMQEEEQQQKEGESHE